jgi:hypothetical protein
MFRGRWCQKREAAVSDVVALIVAPLLGLVGVYVGYVVNARREDRTLRRQLSLERYRERQALFDEVIASAGRRFVAMQRWLWSIETPDAYADLPVRADYFALLQQWNAANWSRRARLRLMLGDTTALRFLDYKDDARMEPSSLHYQFVHAHRAVLSAEIGEAAIASAQRRLDQLNHAWSDFADDIAVDLALRGHEILTTELRPERTSQE